MWKYSQIAKWSLALLLAVVLCGWTWSARADQVEHPESGGHDGAPAAAGHAEGEGHAEGDAHSERDAHGGGHSEGGILEADAQLAFFTLVVFLMLLAVLYKFAWGPISTALDAREARIASNIAAAEKANADAQAVLVKYEEKLAAAADEVRKMIEEARRDAEHTQKDILAKAGQEANALRERALRDIETATAQSLKELAERSANLAVDLAGKIVRQQLGPTEHTRLIEEAVAKFQSPSKN